jgi:hypothetical protein
MQAEPRPVASGPGPDAFRGASRVERVLLPFLREPTLWPVLLAVLFHAVVLVGPLIILVWRDPSPGWPLVGLIALGALSVAGVRVELRDRRRPGPVSGLIGVTWLLCAAGAWGAVRVGLL